MTTTIDSNSPYIGLEKVACPCTTFEEALAKQRRAPSEHVIVDIRSPKEFKEGHVMNALNIALMDDFQRHVIGLTYHKESKDAAIAKGWELFSPLVGQYLSQYDKHKGKTVFVYCWRGGMRSRIVTNVLNMNGFDAIQVAGGYKVYMNEIVWKGLKDFEKEYKPRFVVLFGNTGTRKTEILNRLEDQGLPVIDLEGLAGHRSSLYGGVDLDQKSQKMFSILLYNKLQELNDSKYIFVEGEAHKVGDIHLPLFILKKINSEIKIRVRATIETRIHHLKLEYLKTEDSVRQLHEATDLAAKYIGKKNAEMLHKLLDDADYDTFTEWLLVNYYDTKYRFDKMGHKYALEVDSNDIETCCQQLTDYFRDIDAKDVPPLDVTCSAYKTVAQRISDASSLPENDLPSNNSQQGDLHFATDPIQ